MSDVTRLRTPAEGTAEHIANDPRGYLISLSPTIHHALAELDEALAVYDAAYHTVDADTIAKACRRLQSIGALCGIASEAL